MACSQLLLLLLLATAIPIISADTPWAVGGGCGGSTVGSDGTKPAQCDPGSEYPCCSQWGSCGGTADHCKCEACVDYRTSAPTLGPTAAPTPSSCGCEPGSYLASGGTDSGCQARCAACPRGTARPAAAQDGHCFPCASPTEFCPPSSGGLAAPSARSESSCTFRRHAADSNSTLSSAESGGQEFLLTAGQARDAEAPCPSLLSSSSAHHHVVVAVAVPEVKLVEVHLKNPSPLSGVVRTLALPGWLSLAGADAEGAQLVSPGPSTLTFQIESNKLFQQYRAIAWHNETVVLQASAAPFPVVSKY